MIGGICLIRSQYRRAAGLLSLALLALSAVPARAAGTTPWLTDIAGHWAEGDIRKAVAAGWVNGHPDSSFRPEAPVTRAEFIKMLSKVRGAAPGVPTITDQRVSFLYDRLAEQSHWAVAGGYVRASAASGVVEPADYAYSLNEAGQVASWSLNPDQPLTRREATVLLIRAAGLKYQAEAPHYGVGSVYAAGVNSPPVHFSGVTPAWFEGWAAVAYEKRLIQGYPDRSFQADRSIKRAEAVVLLGRLAGLAPETTNLLDELKPPTTRFMEAESGLSWDLVTLKQAVTFKAAHDLNWDDTAKAWASEPYIYREKVARSHTDKLWHDLKKQDLGPLRLGAVMYAIEGQPNQGLAYATYDGETFAYYDGKQGNGTPFGPGYDLQQDGLVPQPLDVENQLAWWNQTVKSRIPATPTKLYTFPYQYLGEWFTLDDDDVMAWGLEQARALYGDMKPKIEVLGGKLSTIKIQVAPSDTADRAGSYQSLKFGRTLVNNPVLELTYDGQNLTVSRRPSTLRTWLDQLAPKYEIISCGEGNSCEDVRPEVPVARRIVETFIYTLGGKPQQ